MNTPPLCSVCHRARSLGKHVDHTCVSSLCQCTPCLEARSTEIRAARNQSRDAHLVATGRGISR